MSWTDERVETLTKLWEEGLSASQIAEKMGGISRNAVISKVHRLKLSARSRPTAAKPKKVATLVHTEPVIKAPVARRDRVIEDQPPIRRARLPLESMPVPIPRRLSLYELTARTCKWPSGDPLTEDFSFCGNDVKGTRSYCGYHSSLAYQPPYKRWQKR